MKVRRSFEVRLREELIPQIKQFSSLPMKPEPAPLYRHTSLSYRAQDVAQNMVIGSISHRGPPR